MTGKVVGDLSTVTSPIVEGNSTTTTPYSTTINASLLSNSAFKGASGDDSMDLVNKMAADAFDKLTSADNILLRDSPAASAPSENVSWAPSTDAISATPHGNEHDGPEIYSPLQVGVAVSFAVGLWQVSHDLHWFSN